MFNILCMVNYKKFNTLFHMPPPGSNPEPSISCYQENKVYKFEMKIFHYFQESLSQKFVYGIGLGPLFQTALSKFYNWPVYYYFSISDSILQLSSLAYSLIILFPYRYSSFVYSGLCHLFFGEGKYVNPGKLIMFSVSL